METQFKESVCRYDTNTIDNDHNDPGDDPCIRRSVTIAGQWPFYVLRYITVDLRE
jgi:hypothetical protein